MDTIKDSLKDIGNNWQGTVYGVMNPDKDCKVWLEDLDWKIINSLDKKAVCANEIKSFFNFSNKSIKMGIFCSGSNNTWFCYSFYNMFRAV